MNLTQETKFIMDKYNITANKNYGQNFLIDEFIVNSIIEKAEVCKEDLIIEIGPGLGTLTSNLIKKAGRVICIELDSNMINILNDFPNVKLYFPYDWFDYFKYNWKVIKDNDPWHSIKSIK